LQSWGGYIIIYSEVIVKKILIFCLYCMIFTLIPVASILAQGGKDNSKGNPFPALEVSVDEDDILFLSDTTFDDDNDDETSLVPETTDAPEAIAVDKDEAPVTLEITVINEDKSSPVPKTSAVIDKPSRGSADANTTVSAVESAAESAAAAARFAAAAAQSARLAESAAATATAAAATVTAAPQQPPPAVQPQPAPSRLPPQPPARTVVPTVNIIVPQTAPPAAAPAAPPAYRPSMNVTPGMPDPNSNGVYRVQVGSFSNTGLAQQCFNRLKAAGFTPFYEQYGSLYRVVITGIQAADMAGVIRRLEAAGFTDAWIREER
jgi:cell division septation protein DedD